MNRRNLRSGAPGTTPDPSDVDFSEAYGGQGHDREGRQKSTADEISDDLSRVLDGLNDVKKAVQGDDAAAERVAKGEYEGDAGDDDGGNAGRQGGLYEGIADHLIDDDTTRLRKSTDTVGDLSDAVDDGPDDAESNTRTDDDPTTGNPRMVNPDE